MVRRELTFTALYSIKVLFNPEDKLSSIALLLVVCSQGMKMRPFVEADV